MGREIRRVPPGWQHPKSHHYGDYTPLFDETYEEALEKWEEEKQAYSRTDEPFEDWYGEKPDPEFYRPAWPEGSDTAYQIYETVSEGTPTSPVFETEDELVAWLVEQGHSEEAARKFLEHGSVPSIMIVGNRMASNIDAYEPGFLPPKDKE